MSTRAAASGSTSDAVQDFLAYWQAEGARYARQGDYAWMAAQIAAPRVLEIGCGPGFGTQALCAAGKSVLVLENLPECIAAARVLAPAADFLAADVTALGAENEAAIRNFSPDSVLCWLMGVPTNASGAQATDTGRSVVAYREKIHRAVAELAARLPSVRQLHFVDRSALAWQAKETGRNVLAAYHLGKTLLDLPFTTSARCALYRKLDAASAAGVQNKLPPGSVAVLASLLIEKTISDSVNPYPAE